MTHFKHVTRGASARFVSAALLAVLCCLSIGAAAMADDAPKAADQPAVVEDAKAPSEAKPADEPKGASEPNAADAVKPVDETKPADAAKVDGDAKPTDDTKIPGEPKAADEAKPVEQPKATTRQKSANRLINLDPPGEREFVRDEAHLINPQDTKEIKKIADKLLTDKATPILVVTIDSMSQYTKFDMRIEAFAQFLFDQWGIGQEKLNGEDWNTGILLLVSKNDRKARIELGKHWSHEHDRQTDQIMNEIIIPHFKKGEYSAGILAGVEALDKMARGLKMPAGAGPGHAQAGPPSGLAIALMVGLAGLAVFTVISLVRSGAHGWGWLLWAAIFGLVGMLLYNMMSNSGGGSGGGFSGGSFGGGSSGGGGSTGSW